MSLPAFPGKLTYVDGNYQVASAVNLPRFSQPFNGDKGEYIMVQDYEQFVLNFQALPLGSAHPDYPDYFLVSEGQHQDLGGGIIRWTRTYAKIPATRNDFSTLAYSFIGYYGTTANIAALSSFPVLGRNRLTKSVTCRIQYDYFLVKNDTTVLDVDGDNVFVAGLELGIPVILEQRYFVPLGTGTTPFVYRFTKAYDSFFNPANPVLSAGQVNDINYGTATDLIYDIPSDAIPPSPSFSGAVIPTEPSRSLYQTWVNNKQEIVAEASQLSRWLGSIYVRATKFVIAQ